MAVHEQGQPPWAWGSQLSEAKRKNVVMKLAHMIYPYTETNEAAHQDERFHSLYQYTERIEKNVYMSVRSFDDYHKTLAEKIWKIQKKLYEQRQARDRKRRLSSQSTDQIVPPPDSIIPVPAEGTNNPVDAKRIKKESIQRCIQSLVHACRCKDEDCHLPSCAKMKKVVQHTRTCKKKKNGGCPICKQLIALCCYHSKHCDDDQCPVPFCPSIKQRLKVQSRMVNRSRMHEMRRRCQIMTGGSDSAPAPQVPPQMAPQPPIQPPKSAAEQAAHQAVEVAKKQTLFSGGGSIAKQEASKTAPIGPHPNSGQMFSGPGKPNIPQQQMMASRMMTSRMINPNMAPNMNMINNMPSPQIPQSQGIPSQQLPNQAMQQPMTSNAGSVPPNTRPLTTQMVRRPGSGKPNQHFSQQAPVMSGQQMMRHVAPNIPNQGNPTRAQSGITNSGGRWIPGPYQNIPGTYPAGVSMGPGNIPKNYPPMMYPPGNMMPQTGYPGPSPMPAQQLYPTPGQVMVPAHPNMMPHPNVVPNRPTGPAGQYFCPPRNPTTGRGRGSTSKKASRPRNSPRPNVRSPSQPPVIVSPKHHSPLPQLSPHQMPAQPAHPPPPIEPMEAQNNSNIYNDGAERMTERERQQESTLVEFVENL